MQRTQFAGLTLLSAGESLATDGFSFQTRNPAIIDKFLKVGAVTHKHDGHASLVRPTVEPSAAVAASGGTFPADTVLTIGYTAIDAQGGETLVSPSISITTPPLVQAPDGAPSAAADYTGGELRVDTYFYVKTWIDDGGGETTPSPYAQVTRDPGFASGQVKFNNLASGMAAAGAVGWKLYKANFTGQFKYLATGTTNTFTDDGTICADCITPPPPTNTTHQRSSLYVTVPPLPANSVLFRVYVSTGGGFFSPSLMSEYGVASAGALLTYTAYTPSDGRPPDVATAVGGANQIDPDTDILDWSWKRSVATRSALGSGAVADVRMVRNTRRLYTPASASAAASGGWMEVPGNVLVMASGASQSFTAQVLVFSSATVTQQGASAIVLASGGGGGGGGSSAPENWSTLHLHDPAIDGGVNVKFVDFTAYAGIWGPNPASPTPGYYKSPDSIVRLRGDVYAPAASGGYTSSDQPIIAHMPVGYRPATNVSCFAWCQTASSGKVLIIVMVDTAGLVKIGSYVDNGIFSGLFDQNSKFGLDTIQYRAA